MVNVYYSKNVLFSVNEEEKDILQKTHDILNNMITEWCLQDDGATEDEDYWILYDSVKLLEKMFKCGKK